MSDMTLSDVPERVARGVALLDEKRPGWWERINLAELDINECWSCVIGQLYRADTSSADEPFEKGATDLIGWDDYGYDNNAPALIAHGFSMPRNDDEAEPAALTAEWKRVIEERRATAAQIPTP